MGEKNIPQEVETEILQEISQNLNKEFGSLMEEHAINHYEEVIIYLYKFIFNISLFNVCLKYLKIFLW